MTKINVSSNESPFIFPNNLPLKIVRFSSEYEGPRQIFFASKTLSPKIQIMFSFISLINTINLLVKLNVKVLCSVMKIGYIVVDWVSQNPRMNSWCSLTFPNSMSYSNLTLSFDVSSGSNNEIVSRLVSLKPPYFQSDHWDPPIIIGLQCDASMHTFPIVTIPIS